MTEDMDVLDRFVDYLAEKHGPEGGAVLFCVGAVLIIAVIVFPIAYYATFYFIP